MKETTYVLLHKTNGLYYNKNQYNPPVPFGSQKAEASQYVDKDLAELMITTAAQFFLGMFPQDMDLINRNAFIKECVVVPFEE